LDTAGTEDFLAPEGRRVMAMDNFQDLISLNFRLDLDLMVSGAAKAVTQIPKKFRQG